MKTTRTWPDMSFVPCANRAGVLINSVEVAVRNFNFVPMKKMNLTRREICRGKISQRKNQSTHLEERTP
jgi:hypothetical protein